MFRGRLIAGLAAGAAGTAALNVLTYMDMAARGRPSSTVPAELAERLAQRASVDLAAGLAPGDPVENRKQGVGALLGYLTGLGVGLGYGVFRTGFKRPSSLLAGTLLGLVAMAASDVPATVLGVTSPSTWGASGWASDLFPHLAYGLTTAVVFETLLVER